MRYNKAIVVASQNADLKPQIQALLKEERYLAILFLPGFEAEFRQRIGIHRRKGLRSQRGLQTRTQYRRTQNGAKGHQDNCQRHLVRGD